MEKKRKNRKSAVSMKLDPVHLAQEIMLAYFTSFLTSKAAELVFMFRSRRSFKFFSILPLAGNKSDFSVTEYPGRISIWISTYRNNAFSSVSKQFLLRERASHQNIYKHKQLDESFPRQTFQWENLGNRSFSKTLPPPSPPSEPETLIYLTLLDRWFAEA